MFKDYRIVSKVEGEIHTNFFNRFTIYLRGAFGYTLKASSCKFAGKIRCERCKIKYSCPFMLIFKPTRNLFRGLKLLEKLRYPPKPYVFTYPTRINEKIIQFNLRIYGNPIYFEQAILESIKRMSERRFLDGKIRLNIDRIEAVNSLRKTKTLLYTEKDGFLNSHIKKEIILNEHIKEWVINQLGKPIKKREIYIVFQTPTKLLRKGESILETRKVRLSDFIRYLARRRSLLNYFYLGKMFYSSADVRTLMKWADKNVETSNYNIKRIPILVKKSRGFCLGEMTFKIFNEDRLKEVLELLKFGEYFGVGEMTSFGMGQYCLSFHA